MIPTDFMGSALLAVLLFGKLLIALGLAVSVFCAFLVGYIINDICKTIRIKKERRGKRSI